MTIYHITTEAAWKKAEQAGFVTADSLAIEGFIHCSYEAQVAGVLRRYFKNQTNLILIEIDEKKLDVDVREEAATGGELYPHVFGVINRAAIITAHPIPTENLPKG